MSKTEITIRFIGGPLDGCERVQSIRSHWSIIRYEHLPIANDGRFHVYAGERSRDQMVVTLQYDGQRMETSQ